MYRFRASLINRDGDDDQNIIACRPEMDMDNECDIAKDTARIRLVSNSSVVECIPGLTSQYCLAHSWHMTGC